ncbi:MAG: phosphoribosylanthranilate isomerase [Pyrinomonadaceae bacterium]
MTKVKICGITNLEDALYAVECGADMLGFNFYRGSKRYVEPSIAAEIVRELSDSRVENVGVFVNAEAAEIAEIAKQVGLNAVQLHGDETPEAVAEVKQSLPELLVVKAVRVGGSLAFRAATVYVVDHLLLDGEAGSAFGGAGQTFDWELARGIEGMILAGGLTPHNVADAIRVLRPHAVDVASGVESSPGKKDPEKVAAFIKAAKEAL